MVIHIDFLIVLMFPYIEKQSGNFKGMLFLLLLTLFHIQKIIFDHLLIYAGV